MSSSGKPSHEQPSLVIPVLLFLAAVAAFAWIQTVWHLPGSWTWTPAGAAVGLVAGVGIGWYLRSIENRRDTPQSRRRVVGLLLSIEILLGWAAFTGRLRLSPPVTSGFLAAMAGAVPFGFLAAIATIAVLDLRAHRNEERRQR